MGASLEGADTTATSQSRQRSEDNPDMAHGAIPAYHRSATGYANRGASLQVPPLKRPARPGRGRGPGRGCIDALQGSPPGPQGRSPVCLEGAERSGAGGTPACGYRPSDPAPPAPTRALATWLQVTCQVLGRRRAGGNVTVVVMMCRCAGAGAAVRGGELGYKPVRTSCMSGTGHCAGGAWCWGAPRCCPPARACGMPWCP